jgi:uncharacterized membrane protein
MNPTLNEWLNLVVRWLHVFAGILWVGTTYYFTWLDARLHEEGSVWMVHSGGFYVVEKQKPAELLPKTLHWFRWEAALTWLSGILLLALVYYHGGLMVDDSVADISRGAAIGIGVGTIVAAWVVYDLLVQSPLGRKEMAVAAAGFLLIVGVAYGLSQVLSGRAAYMHVGAALGTIMTANVWERILPAQRRLIALAREGKPASPELAARAKLRSKHNTFLAVPVVFIMLSSHFPAATYGHRYGWAILGALVLAGWAAAKIVRRA